MRTRRTVTRSCWRKNKIPQNTYGWREARRVRPFTTRATEAIICLKSPFIPSIPVGAVRMLTRETGGKLADGSTEGYFTNIQIVEPARQKSMPDGRTKNLAFFAKISENCHPISIEKRAAAERKKKSNGQGGHTKKVRRKYSRGREGNRQAHATAVQLFSSVSWTSHDLMDTCVWFFLENQWVDNDESLLSDNERGDGVVVLCGTVAAYVGLLGFITRISSSVIA